MTESEQSEPAAGQTAPETALKHAIAEGVNEASDDDVEDEGVEPEDEPSAESERHKPWWAIICVAALAGIGSQIVTTSVKVIGQKIESITSKPVQLNFLVLQKSSQSPITGVQIVLRDAEGKATLASGVTNQHGALARDVSVRYGAYLLEVHYKQRDVEYARSEQIVISKPFYAEKMDFDPSEWLEVTTTLVAEAASTTASSGTLAANLPLVTQGPPWLGTAYAELGQTEFPLPNRNPRIDEYWRSVPGFPVPPNERVDWASAFVNWVLQKNGVSGTRSAASRSWLSWGKVVDSPKPGCIAVFWTQSPTSQFGHVGFFISSDEESVAVLGGDSAIITAGHGLQFGVAIKRLRRASFLGCREPLG